MWRTLALSIILFIISISLNSSRRFHIAFQHISNDLSINLWAHTHTHSHGRSAYVEKRESMYAVCIAFTWSIHTHGDVNLWNFVKIGQNLKIWRILMKFVELFRTPVFTAFESNIYICVLTCLLQDYADLIWRYICRCLNVLRSPFTCTLELSLTISEVFSYWIKKPNTPETVQCLSRQLFSINERNKKKTCVFFSFFWRRKRYNRIYVIKKTCQVS